MPGIGYYFQSLAFLINIERWKVILRGGHTMSLQTRSKIKLSKRVKRDASI